MRSEHLLDDADGNARLERKARDPAVTWVELAVVPPDRIAQLVVAARAAERLDVLVLVERRHPLRSHLPAEPVGFFQQHDVSAIPGRGERRGDSARAATGDQDSAFFNTC